MLNGCQQYIHHSLSRVRVEIAKGGSRRREDRDRNDRGFRYEKQDRQERWDHRFNGDRENDYRNCKYAEYCFFPESRR